MNRFRPFFNALLIALAALAVGIVSLPGLFTGNAAATAGAGTLTFVAPTGKVTVGDTVQVTVQMQGASGPVAAAQAEVVYNPAVLEFRSVAPGGFLSGTGRQVVCPPAVAAPAQSSGRATFACASTGASDGPMGSGTLVTLTFGAIGPGQSSLALEGIGLVNSSRPPAAIGSSTQATQLTVEAQTPVETTRSLWLPQVNR